MGVWMRSIIRMGMDIVMGVNIHMDGGMGGEYWWREAGGK
jgi:hypothetical protein